MATHTTRSSPGLAIRDLIVVEGPNGAERILVPGLTLTLRDGETVALSAPRPAASALLLVLSGRIRARYGSIAVRGRVGTGAPVRPTVPRGLSVCSTELVCPPGTAVCVIDARSSRKSGTGGTNSGGPRISSGQGTAHGQAPLGGALPPPGATTLLIVEEGCPESDLPPAGRWVDVAGNPLAAGAAKCRGAGQAVAEEGRAGWLSA